MIPVSVPLRADDRAKLRLIARRHGMDPDRLGPLIAEIVHRALVVSAPSPPATPRPRRWTPADEAELRRLYQVEQLELERIGENLGRTRQAVSAKLNELGIAVRRPPSVVTFTADEDATIRRMHGALQPDRVIAEALGRHRVTVGERRRELGLPALFGAGGRLLVQPDMVAEIDELERTPA